MPDKALVRSRWTHLRVRLPLAISALIALSLVAFLTVSFVQVRRELLRVGHARAQAAADQLANLLTLSLQQQQTESLRVAQDPAVIASLQARDAGSMDTARQRLTTLSRPGQPPAELWDAAGERLLAGTPVRADRPVAALPAVKPPAEEGFSPFQSAGQTVFWDHVLAVHQNGAPAPRGYVITRRALSTQTNSDAISRLVGPGAIIRLGDATGSVWSDLSKLVRRPAVDIRPGYIAGDRDEAGGTMDGAAASVRGTRWLVTVEFPRDAITAPARTYLMRMLAVAAILVLASAAAASFLSARITSPLLQLTQASEALAAGRFEQPIDTGRRDEIGRLAVSFSSMAAEVQASRQELEARVEERTRAVVALNRELESTVGELKTLASELESFSYSVSHDLRAPLRHITGFASLLEQRAGKALDEEASRYVRTIVNSAARMGRLVDDLLTFSRMGRAEMLTQTVDLGGLFKDVIQEVAQAEPGRRIEWKTHPLPIVAGDRAMLRLAVTNLVSNAVKYTSPRDVAEIEIGTQPSQDGERVVYIKDNGVGFDMQYVGKLFGVFQRLHAAESFDGTGIGLANVRRIVHRHGGRAWAEGTVDRGATFFISLPEAAPAVR